MWHRPSYVQAAGIPQKKLSASNLVPYAALPNPVFNPIYPPMGGSYGRAYTLSYEMYGWLLNIATNYPVLEPMMSVQGELFTMIDGDCVLAYTVPVPAFITGFPDVLVEPANDEFWTSVRCLLPFNADFKDVSNYLNPTTPVGSLALGVANGKFGTNAGIFNATDWLQVTAGASGTVFNTGAGDCTIELRVYPTAFSGASLLCYGAGSGLPLLEITTSASGVFTCFFGTVGNVGGVTSGVGLGGAQLTLNAWNDISIQRTGTTLKIGLNGQYLGSSIINYTFPWFSPLTISLGQTMTNSTAMGNPFFGRIDQFRVTAASRPFKLDTKPAPEF